MSLNDTAIQALKPKARRYDVTDREGLLLEVHASGKKVWRFRYRLNGKREKLTLGPYPAVGCTFPHAALHLLLLVPVRQGELLAARREHFDDAATSWDISAENSKNGAPIRHKLPKQAQAIIK